MQKSSKKFSIEPHFFDQLAWQENKFVIGVDEAGRGCMAGPVVVAAATLSINNTHNLLKDSKLLTHTELLIAFDWLKENAHYAISFAHHRQIDSINIYQATLNGMRRATNQLILAHGITPKYILVDAMPLTLDNPTLEIKHFPFGESLSYSIAAASIIAKVTRDRLLERFDGIFPGYELGNHKGYITPAHQAHVFDLGMSVIHRKTYVSTVAFKKDKADGQQSLF